MKHLKRRAVAAAASSAVALAGLAAVAPAAHAVPADAPCPNGDLCVYSYSSTPNHANPRIYADPNARSGLSVQVNTDGGYAWNNGNAEPGLDHVELYTRTQDGTNWKICLHYGRAPVFPGQGEVTAINLDSFEKVTRVQWRGECADTTWHLA